MLKIDLEINASALAFLFFKFDFWVKMWSIPHNVIGPYVDAIINSSIRILQLEHVLRGCKLFFFHLSGRPNY